MAQMWKRPGPLETVPSLGFEKTRRGALNTEGIPVPQDDQDPIALRVARLRRLGIAGPLAGVLADHAFHTGEARR